jgi:hypothetical protein
LVLYVSPPRGEYVHARCPAGRPPWWPTWLPLQTELAPGMWTPGYAAMRCSVVDRCRCS